MKIDKNLNLVIPIERATGPIYVHATPVTREIFEKYYLPISKAFSMIYGQGLHAVAGPRVAYFLLKQASEELGIWDGQGSATLAQVERDGVKNGLINEIRRLSNIVAPSDYGWETLPLDDAISRSMLDEDEVSEVLNAIVFFILNSAMHRHQMLVSFLAVMNDAWGTQISSLNATEFARSLPILKPDESSGEKVLQSSIPA